MNKTNGYREKASASTSLYNREHFKSTNQRTSTSGLSFLKWFKKNEKSIDSRCSTKSVGSNFYKNHNSHETLSPPSSPTLGYLSPSSSCDSVQSTSTTGFAFIKPNNYRPANEIHQRTIFSHDFETAGSHRNLVRSRPDLTLRRKYCLYDADTLTSTEGEYDNVQFRDRSLPYFRKKALDDQRTLQGRRRARRTVSDSSKDKKAGAYVHVKGKRKAPPPPQQHLTNGNVEHQGVIQKASTGTGTLNRKKRRAPPPPNSPLTQSTTSDGMLNDSEIRDILRPSSSNVSSISYLAMRSSAPAASQNRENCNPAQKLSEQQKQLLIDNIVRVTRSPTPQQPEEATAPPASPVSPRPWYKRPISSNRESAIPFKREVVLKTMEKRKSKHKEKTSSKSDDLPEVSHSRSSLFEASSKFGFFLRHKEHSDKDKEKRRSGIGIPNISELDREAAEIVHREYATARAAQKSERDKYFAVPDHITLQQEMFGSKTNVDAEEAKSEAEEDAVKSAKDLISKFEANTNGPRITLNTSFIGRKENFMKADEVKPNEGNPLVEDQTTTSTEIAKQQPKVEVPITKLSWTCSFCTLENPEWRILCEACEHIKPYEKRTSVELKVSPLAKPVQATAVIVPSKDGNLNESLSGEIVKNTQTDLEKKTEKVLKYFMPKTPANNPLAKSSSESSIGKRPLFRKSPSPHRPPSGSPQLTRQNRPNIFGPLDVVKPNGFLSGFRSTEAIPEEKESLSPMEEVKKPLMDSSVVVTTVTPVFFDTTTVIQNTQAVSSENVTAKEAVARESTPPKANYPKIDLREVRKVRLAKFSVPQEPIQVKPIPINDHDSLEREKKRLRDMIQAMNAKAIAERYPTNSAPKTVEVYQVQLPQSSSQTVYDEPKTIYQDNVEQINNVKTSQQANLKADPVNLEATSSANIQTNDSILKTVNSPKQSNYEQIKLGAIKKVFAKNQKSELPKISPDPDSNKPKKVSISVQTSPVVKKSLTPEDVEKSNRGIYANVPIYENNMVTKPGGPSEVVTRRVREISQQLISANGISEFKESLKNPLETISATDTLALSNIMRNLETAIAEGQYELAARIAMDLAKMKVSLHVTKQTNRPISRSDVDFERSIIVDMYVEDKYSQKGPIQITITPLLTIAKLKEKIYADFDIPIGVQRWLINDELAMDDKKTLLEFGIKDTTSGTLYLYIVAPDVHFYEVKKTNLENPLLPKTSQEKAEKTEPKIGGANHPELGATALPQPNRPDRKEPKTDWTCRLCTLINPIEKIECLACSTPRSGVLTAKQPTAPEPVRPSVQLRHPEKRNDLNKSSPNRKSTDVYNIVDIKIDVKKTVTDQMKPLTTTTATKLTPNITKIRYRGVDNFNPNRKDGDRPKPIPRKSPKQHEAPKKPQIIYSHYDELLGLDNADVVANIEPFECPICFMKFETGQGAILRDCLHTFCKECLAHTVQYSEEAEIKCPFMDAEYSCDSVLQEREVKALVTKEIYELHLIKSMRMAEHRIENAFHCKTPNCRGWCIFEDNVNQFKCPVCKITNCLTCRVIHDGLTCKQYQDRLNSDCDSNVDAKRTKEMLEAMLRSGEAMNCPTCQVVMMKKWGCDWLKCSMCKTEVCWVTRGPRWGPGGKGDTSGGCKCGVNSVKCHPKCNYCH